MAITLYEDKLSELTKAEMDTNFKDLRDSVDVIFPKENTNGIRIDNSNPDFGWHDLIGDLHVYGEVGDASRTMYRGGIKSLQFDLSDSAYVDFHIPHDYLMGSAIYIHVHWSHNSPLVTGGSTTWAFEMMYAKGHNQSAFEVPVIASVIQPTSNTQYQHMIAETIASVPSGSGVALDTSSIEPDGIIQCRVYLDSNDITVSSGLVPMPFAHFVDIHYQSTGIATKNKSPDFWV